MSDKKKKYTTSTFTPGYINKVAGFAHIPISEEEAKNLAKQFNDTLDVVKNLDDLDTKYVEPTSQVTGLENVFREDKVDEENMLTQEQALSQAKKTYKGFFVVDQILDAE